MVTYTQWVPSNKWQKRLLKSDGVLRSIESNAKNISKLHKEIVENSRTSKGSSLGRNKSLNKRSARSQSQIDKSNKFFASIGTKFDLNGYYAKRGTKMNFGVVYQRHNPKGYSKPAKGQLENYEKSHGSWQDLMKQLKGRTGITKKSKKAYFR